MENQPGGYNQTQNIKYEIDWTRGMDQLDEKRINNQNGFFKLFKPKKKTLREQFIVKEFNIDTIDFGKKHKLANEVGNEVFKDKHDDLKNKMDQMAAVQIYVNGTNMNTYISNKNNGKWEKNKHWEKHINYLKESINGKMQQPINVYRRDTFGFSVKK